ELIKGCKVVVCHDSTAIQFAVLYGKPLIFLTTDELAGILEGRSVEKMAAEFGKSPVNVDRDIRDVNWSKDLCVDAGKYADYRNRYIKTDGSPDIPFWEIVIDQMEKSRGDSPKT